MAPDTILASCGFALCLSFCLSCTLNSQVPGDRQHFTIGSFQAPNRWHHEHPGLTSELTCCEQDVGSETSSAPSQPELSCNTLIHKESVWAGEKGDGEILSVVRSSLLQKIASAFGKVWTLLNLMGKPAGHSTWYLSHRALWAAIVNEQHVLSGSSGQSFQHCLFKLLCTKTENKIKLQLLQLDAD